jgi:PIN domain nuclease of toxin-antitoxin system
MRYLLDTHSLLWIVDDHPDLGSHAKNIYLNEEMEIFVSIASIWEIAIKTSLNKLEIPGTLAEFVKEHIRGNKIDIMSIELKHLYHLETLPYYHRDPFDRILISQALAENIPVLTRDLAFDKYPVQRIW